MIRILTGAVACALLAVLFAYVLDPYRGPLLYWLEWHWDQAQLFAIIGAIIGAALVYTFAPGGVRVELTSLWRRMARLRQGLRQSATRLASRLTAAAREARYERHRQQTEALYDRNRRDYKGY